MTDYRHAKVSAIDLAFFYGLPCALGAALLAFRFHFRTDAINGFLNAFAILTGLMLNLLVLVFSLAVSADRTDAQLRKWILKEVFTNVCYCILIAIVVVCTALTDLSYMRSLPSATAGPVSTFVLAAFTFNFVLTLLMVMKRMYKLISREFDVSSSGKKAA